MFDIKRFLGIDEQKPSKPRPATTSVKKQSLISKVTDATVGNFNRGLGVLGKDFNQGVDTIGQTVSRGANDYKNWALNNAKNRDIAIQKQKTVTTKLLGKPVGGVVNTLNDMGRAMSTAPYTIPRDFIVRPAAQDVAAPIALEINKRRGAGNTTWTPTNSVAKEIFGNKQLNPISENYKQGVKTASGANDWNIPFTNTKVPGRSVIANNPELSALIGMGGIIAGDVTPFGGAKKKAAGLIAKTQDATSIAKTLKKDFGIVDDVLTNKLIKTNKADDVARIIDDARNVGKGDVGKTVADLRAKGWAEKDIKSYVDATNGKMPKIDNTKLNNLNPTGGLYVDYTPQARATMPLADNMTTYNKAYGGGANEMITIYRGAPKNQKSIVAGDFITTNKDLAKSYTGDGNVLEMKVKKSDILADKNDLGNVDEFIYRPSQPNVGKGKVNIDSAEDIIRKNYNPQKITKTAEGETALKMRLSLDKIENSQPITISKNEIKKDLSRKIMPIEASFNPDTGTYTLIDGHHRLLQAKANGMKDIDVNVTFPKEVTDANGNFVKYNNLLDSQPKVPTAAESILSPNKVETPLLNSGDNLLLPEGKIKSVADAKKVFKKTGESVDFVNPVKPNKKVFIAGDDGTAIRTSSNANNYLKKKGYDDMVGEVADLQDISNLDKGMKDIYRNFRDAFGGQNSKRYAQIKKDVLDPLDNAKLQFVDDQVKVVTKLKNDIVDGLGIKKGSKESAAVQMLGEGKMTYEEVLTKFGKEKADRIVKANDWFRSQYDTLLDEVNQARAAIWPNNPDKIIPRRDDYYRHFTDLASGFEGLKNIFDSPSNISSSLSGISEVTKPKSKWLSFAQKRTGDKTTFDAVGGFLDYAKAQTYAKNIDPQIDVFRQLRESIAKKTEGVIDSKKLNNFTEFLDDFANDLAGKTNPLDRAFQKYIPGGRTTFRAMNWLNNRVKANVILGNASSAIAQIFNVPQGMAEAGIVNFMKGVGRTFKDVLSGGDNALSQSRFIKERYSGDIYNQFDVKMLDKTKDFAAWMIGALDEVGTKSIWNGIYEKGLKQGLKGDELIRFADDATRRMVAGRGVGEVPLLQKAKVFQLVAPFQLEVANLWHIMKDNVDQKQFGKLAALFISGYAMNKGAEKLRGSGVVFDPIQAMVDSYGIVTDDEKGYSPQEKALRVGGRLSGEVLSNLPGGQTVAQFYPEYGFNVPGTEEKLTRKEFFGKEDPSRFGGGPLFTKGFEDPLYKVLPSFGGQQIKKTIDGLGSTVKGFAEDAKKNIQFPIQQNTQNIVRSALFGKYATTEGQDYIKNDKRALSENESNFFKAGNTEVYDQSQLNRKVDDEKTALKKGIKSGKAEMIDTNTQRLSNGKIAVLQENGDIKTYDTEEKWKEDKTKIAFEKSGKNFQEKDGMVYRKKTDGSVEVMTKDKYSYQLGTAKLAKYKRSEDLTGWMKTAESQLNSIEKQMQDPNIDELDMIKLEEDYNALLTSAKKYASYGGFTKPKSGKSKKANMDRLAKLLEDTTAENSSSQQALRKIVKGISIKKKAVKA